MRVQTSVSSRVLFLCGLRVVLFNPFIVTNWTVPICSRPYHTLRTEMFYQPEYFNPFTASSEYNLYLLIFPATLATNIFVLRILRFVLLSISEYVRMTCFAKVWILAKSKEPGGFRDSEDSTRGLLGCDMEDVRSSETLVSYRNTSRCHSLKMEAAGSFETLVSWSHHYTASQPRKPWLKSRESWIWGKQSLLRRHVDI